jgi:hypothetical protein
VPYLDRLGSKESAIDVFNVLFAVGAREYDY